MGSKSQLVIYTLAGVILTAALSSYIWWNKLKSLQSQFDQARSVSGNEISALEKEISEIKDIYHATLTDLETARAIGQQTQQQVSDEQTRYEQLMADFEQVKNSIPEIHKQYEIDLSRLERARNFLALQNDSLKKEIYQLRDQAAHNDDLLQEKKSQLDNQLANLKAQNTALQNDVKHLKNELMQHQQLLTKLKNENDEYEGILNSLQGNEKKPDTSPAVTATNIPGNTPTNTDEKDLYRQVRLQSLDKALQNRSSNERRLILINVIPTIPHGISGEELVSFTNNMNSADLLSVIKETNKFLVRPLNKQAINSVLAKLDGKDAEIAKGFFYNGE